MQLQKTPLEPWNACELGVIAVLVCAHGGVCACDAAVVGSPRLQARQSFGAVELEGLIYVLGGENKDGELITVEVFDPHFSTWKPQTSMTMIRKVTNPSVLTSLCNAML